MRRVRRLLVPVILSVVAAACGASPEVRETVAARHRSAALGAPGGLGGEAAAPAADQAGTTEATLGSADLSGGPAAAKAGSTPVTASPSGFDGSRSVVTSGPLAARSTGPASARASAQSAPPAAGTPGGPSPGAGPVDPTPGGNGGATDVGVTARSVKVGGLFFNGSWLDKYSQVAEQAAVAYFRYVNDQGGVHGRKIEFVGCDTAGTVNGTQGCARKLAEQEKVFSLGPSLDFNLDTTVPYLAQHKLPWIGSPGLYDAEFDSPYMFASQYRGREMGAIAATFMAGDKKARTIGVSWNTQPPGPPCFEGVRRIADAMGARIVVDASNGPTESDLSPQVIRMRSANPDAIIFCNDPVNAVKFVQAAGRQNYKPPAGWIGAFCLADDVPQAMGPAGVGFYCVTSYDPYFGNTPGIVEMNRITRHYFPSHFHHAYTMPVFAGAKIFVEALRRVGPNLTRERLLAVMRSMDAYDTRMGMTFNFADRSRERASGMVMEADGDLRWKPVTGRFEVGG